jgi:amidase
MAGMKRAAEFIAFTPPFNASGQPAINLPLHWNDDGLPIGVQLVATYGREDLLLAVASQLEAAHPWADRRPPVC